METVSSKLQEVHRGTINQLKKLEDVKRLIEPKGKSSASQLIPGSIGAYILLSFSF